MSETFLTSDHHYGHQNILKYEAAFRPFATIEDMNEALIENWNSVVGKYDKVYHLGDFAFGRANIAIAGRLNGQKRLILGNHDCYPVEEYLKYFLSVHGAMYWKDCILTHVPVHPQMLEDGRAKINLHGHTHNLCIMSDVLERDLRYINCSVEQHNLTPVNVERILNNE